jgi:hypothetical protein
MNVHGAHHITILELGEKLEKRGESRKPFAEEMDPMPGPG